MTTVLALAEHRGGELRDVSFELITAGREVADAVNGELAIAVVGGDVDRFANALNRTGVDTVYTVNKGDEFNHGIMLQSVKALAAELEPIVILIPHSVNGLDYAPAVANALDRPIVTDAVSLEANDRLEVTREMYGSKVATTVAINPPAIITTRPANWPHAEDTGEAEITAFEFDLDENVIRSTVTGYAEASEGDVDITDADVLVSIGRGIGEEDNLDLIFRLADALGATVSSSRPIVDAGWLPKNRQVGQSGKTVNPDVYMAIGISGAVQHVSGMKGADTIIVINTDPNAPIFDIADIGIVGNLFDVVPPLIEEFE